MITKRGFALRGSCFCEKYNYLYSLCPLATILITKITAAQNIVALSYHRMRRLYFPVVILVVTILIPRSVCDRGIYFYRFLRLTESRETYNIFLEFSLTLYCYRNCKSMKMAICCIYTICSCTYVLCMFQCTLHMFHLHLQFTLHTTQCTQHSARYTFYI